MTKTTMNSDVFVSTADIPAQLVSVHNRYGDHVALASVDLQLRAGRVLALLGPNGAGKSTAASLLLSLQLLRLLLVAVLGTLPFCALGLLIGSLVKGTAAPAVVILVYLPMALLSGLWLPLSMLPAVIGKLALLWPAWHLGQLPLKVVGMDVGHSIWMHLILLAVFTAVCLLLALRRLQRA